MPITIVRPKRLRFGLPIAICLVSGLYSATASAQNVSTPMFAEVVEESTTFRLRMAVPAGAIESAQLNKTGKTLYIYFRNQTPDVVASAIHSLNKSQWIKSMQVVEQQGRTIAILHLKQSAAVADESVVLGSNGRLAQWEMVLTKALETNVTVPVQLIAVSDVAVQDVNGVKRFVIKGDKSLIAEVSLPDSGDGLVVDLPRVDATSLASIVASSASLSSFASTKVQATDTGARLTLQTKQALDVLDAKVSFIDALSITEVDMVLDAPAKMGDANLNQIRIDQLSGQIQLVGLEGAQLNAYLVDSPKRLMVDVLGVPPEKVASAVEKFQVGSGVKRIRYGDTRLGSARLEITPDDAYAQRLQASYQQSANATSMVALKADEKTKGMSAAEITGAAAVAVIAAPLAAVAAIASAFSSNDKTDSAVVAKSSESSFGDLGAVTGLDLRYKPKFNFAQEPRIVVKPITLATDKITPDTSAAKFGQGKGYALLGVFDTALSQDSAYQVAKSEYLANIEAIPQARAGYLPQASFDYTYSGTRQSVNRSKSITPGTYEYPYNNWSLTLSQPIFRKQNLIKMDQAEVAVEQAKLALLAAEQDLIMRVSNAYLGVLATKDALELVRAEREATEKQYELASARFKNGLGTKTQLSEAEGRVALVKAREIDAEYKFADARLSLKQIVGDEIADVTTFREDFMPAMPIPAAPEPWLKAAVEQNLALQSRKMAVDIAQLEVGRQKAAYLPTVDAVASAGQRDSERTLYSSSQEQVDTLYDVSLRLRMPLYDGGMTSSLVREATAKFDKSKQEHQQEHRQTEKLVRSSFSGVTTSAQMLTALRAGVRAQEMTLASKVEGYKAGVESVVSVLDSYRAFYSSRRDYLQARYDYLVNRLKLKQAVGSLSRQDLIEVAELLN